MNIIINAIGIFAIVWVALQWIEMLLIKANKVEFLKYMCRKCISFWTAIIITIYSTQDLFIILSTASIAALIAVIADDNLKL
jgi:hypothetical protein